MNQISFVIAPDAFGVGPGNAVEAVIDGVSLVDWIARATGEIGWLGLLNPDLWLAEWRSALSAPSPQEITVLGCTCGIPDCSSVTAYMESTDTKVRWSRFVLDCPPGDDIDEDAFDAFEFDRSSFVTALNAPVRADQPIREQHDLVALAAGQPPEHDAWLRAMTRALGRDFFSPVEPEETKRIVRAGLRAFADAGNPMTDAAVRRWATGRRFSDDAINRIVASARSLAP